MERTAEVTPEDIRNFEGRLSRTTEGIHDSLGLLRRDLSWLGESWRDREFLRFCEEFDEVLRMLQTFVGKSAEFSAFLFRKAGAGDDYIDQR